MAWTTPITWTAATAPTATQFNAHVRDNLNFLFGNILFGELWTHDPRTIDSAAVPITTGVANAGRSRWSRLCYGGDTFGGGVAIAVDTQGTGNQINVGVYRNEGEGQTAHPGARIAERAPIAMPAVGAVFIAFGQTAPSVKLGDWLAIAGIWAGTGSHGHVRGAQHEVSVIGKAIAGDVALGGLSFSADGFPLPDTGPEAPSVQEFSVWGLVQG